MLNVSGLKITSAAATSSIIATVFGRDRTGGENGVKAPGFTPAATGGVGLTEGVEGGISCFENGQILSK